MNKEPLTPVVIRVWQANDNGVFALFPTHPADMYGASCGCYQHVGQHSSAYYFYCIDCSRPATEREAKPLLRELRQIGHKLRVIKRVSPQMHEQRREAAKA